MSDSDTKVRCTLRQCRDGEVRESRGSAVTLVTATGICSPALIDLLDRRVLRAETDVGLDLRDLQDPTPALIPQLKKWLNQLRDRGLLLLLHSPPQRLLDALTLDGSNAVFTIYHADGSIQEGVNLRQESELQTVANVALGTHNPRRGSAQQIVDFEQDLARASELESGLESARRIAMRLMGARLGDLDPFDFTTCYTPHDRVGGDFFTVVRNSRYIGVGIGDVAGHGIAAALTMGAARKTLQIRGADSLPDPDLEAPALDPAAVLRQVNRDLVGELEPYCFVTAAFLILDRISPRVSIARAGHTLPILVSPSNDDAIALQSPGIALGMDIGPLFDSAIANLEHTFLAGDTLILYTDGLTEAENPDRCMFERERIIQTFREHGAPRSAEVARRTLLEEHQRFLAGNSINDDFTLICLRRQSPR